MSGEAAPASERTAAPSMRRAQHEAPRGRPASVNAPREAEMAGAGEKQLPHHSTLHGRPILTAEAALDP